jgi:hypothetical protein
LSQLAAVGDLTEAWWNPNANFLCKALGKIGKNRPTNIFRAMAIMRAQSTDPDKLVYSFLQ